LWPTMNTKSEWIRCNFPQEGRLDDSSMCQVVTISLIEEL